jgi:hypothetical protein
MQMKDIKGYEGLYAVTDDGKVWSYITNKWLKGGIDRDGYTKFILTKNKNIKSYSVHRLVAEAFIPNPNNYPIVCHLVEATPHINSVTNLFWGTQQMNVGDCANKGRRREVKGVSSGTAKLTDTDVIKIRNTPKFRGSGVMLAQKFNVTTATISSIRLGKNWNHI